MIFKKNVKVMAVLLIAVISLSLLGGCSKESSTLKPENSHGVNKTLTFGAQADFKSSSEARSLVFDFMTVFKENLEVTPGLLASWEVNGEGKKYILNLQKGVKFHNGQEFTAEVAKFSIGYWGKYDNSNYPKYLNDIKVIDNTTLEVSFNKPFFAFLEELTGIRATLPETVDDKGNVTEWNGTGPFILKEHNKDQNAVLELNINYWNQEKMPQIKKVVWQTIPNENSRIMALKSGQVDAIGVTEHHLSLPYAGVPELEKTPGIKVLKPAPYSLNTTEAYVFNYKKGALTDINIRKAIVNGIDRNSLTAKLFHNIPVPTGHFLLPQYIDGPKNVEEYTYNPTAAKQALAAAGYSTEKPIKLTLLTQNHQVARDTAVFLQANLKEIGIDLEINSLEKNLFEEKAKAGDFDIALTHAWTVPPARYMQWRGLSDKYDNFGIGFKVDSKIEKLVDTVLTAPDKKDRDQAWDEIWQLQYNFYPGTSLFVRARVFAYKENISGFYFNPRVMTIDLSKVSIK
jgi:ABC-type transport system substrate-binding protein